jgi:uncharacterized protein (DUF4415 family)
MHTRKSAIERDEKPELGDAWFREADAYAGDKLVRRGRPKAANPKVAVSLRLDPDVLAWFKHAGGGWQTRINEVLRKAAGI